MLSLAQLVEVFVVLCTVHGYLFCFFRVRNLFVRAQDKSGPVRLDTLPTGLLGTPFNLLQAVSCFLLPTVYVFTVVSSGFQQPSWMGAFAFPETALGIRLEGMPKNGTRLLACLAVVLIKATGDKALDHLSDQYHPIGRREKPRIVQTGPYAWVRHPLYTLGILQAVVQSLTFWSYAPLYAAAVIATVFSIKIPIEEEAIRRDHKVGEEYRAYMRKVPAKLIPYVCLSTLLFISAMFSTNQLLEIFIVLCTVDHFRYAFSKVGDASVKARSKSGPVRPESMPTRLSMLISPIDGLVYFLVPTLYIVSVAVAGFQQPRWMHPLALPDVVNGVELDAVWKSTARVAASIASIAMQSPMDYVFDHLGDQFHAIGRREKSRIVQTGPYAWVRHPLYAFSLLQTALWTLMYWSYAPLFVLVVATIVTVVKIRIEEDAILRDDAVKEEYRAYMRRVPAKLVPYIW